MPVILPWCSHFMAQNRSDNGVVHSTILMVHLKTTWSDSMGLRCTSPRECMSSPLLNYRPRTVTLLEAKTDTRMGRRDASMAPVWRRMALIFAALVMALASVPSGVTGATAVSPVAAKFHVNVQVFFRAFCPACQWFVGDPLLELIRQDEFRNIIDLNVYPAAGMIEKNGVFDCEGGDLECEGHQWEVCIIDMDRTDVVKYVGNLACIEGDESGEVGEWETKLGNCFTKEQREVLQECYDKRSQSLLRGMLKAKNFERVEWMPYTIVEDVVLGTPSQGVGLLEMQTQVCKTYKGPKRHYPDTCEQLVGPQKEFAPDEPDVTAAVVATSAVPAANNGVTPKPLEPVKVEGEANDDAEEEEVDMPMKGDSEDAKELANKVRIEVYWRAFCPGCMAFISKPLLKLLRNEEFRKIVDFRPVPAAGTTVDAKGNFVCTQGMVECKGHRWLSCAIEEFPKLEELIEGLACLESKDNKGSRWSVVIGKCFSAENQKKMKSCFDNKSKALLTKHVEQVAKVDIQWVPYVLLNSVVLGDARHGIGYKQLQDEVCRAYKGREDLRPTACQPKRLRQDTAQDNAKETEAPMIKPCPPKKDGDAKKAAAAAAAMALDKDVPGAAFKRPDDIESDAKEARELADNGKAAAKGEGFSMSSLLFPLGCFAILFVLARRFTGDHKKYA